MSLIATLANLGTLNKFCGIMEKAGLPADFFLRAINDREFRTDLVTWTRNRLGCEDPRRNPYQVDYRIQVAALRRMNDEFGWNIDDEQFDRLEMDVPEWPTGRRAFRSFEVRMGEGDQGVWRTFEMHMQCIDEVFGGKIWRLAHLVSGKRPNPSGGPPVDRLRLLLGNHTHRPCVRWCLIDLDANKRRKSITAVRGPASLADQGLVLAWLFPDFIRSLGLPGEVNRLIFGGYEVNIPEDTGEQWNHALSISRDRRRECVNIGAAQRHDNDSNATVPEFIE